MSATPKHPVPPDACGAHSLHRLVGPRLVFATTLVSASAFFASHGDPQYAVPAIVSAWLVLLTYYVLMWAFRPWPNDRTER
jgi:hypothetical protein